jgi:hypothetical protein
MRRFLGQLFTAARLGLAAVLLFACWQDRPAAVATRQFESLPDFDFVAQAREFAGHEQFAEALLAIDTGLLYADDPARRTALTTLKTEVETERDRLLRRFEQVGIGALSGRGETPEALAGAVAADLFVFGDVRDLVIQAGQALRGQETDEVIVGLSAAGILLTAAPELDLGASLLKFARKVGALTQKMAGEVLRLSRKALRERSAAPLTEGASDAAALSRAARPGGAVKILRGIEDAGELRIAARVAQQPGGPYALLSGGRGAITFLKDAGPPAEALLLRAVRKGPAAVGFVTRKGAFLLQAHPLLGLVKALRKGTLQDLVAQLMTPEIREMLLWVALGWFTLEAFALAFQLAPRQRRYR